MSTVLLHCPITSITRKLSYWCPNRLVITNHVVIVLIICNTNYLSNGLNSHDTFPFIKTYCLHCYSQILTNSWSSDSSIKIPMSAELDNRDHALIDQAFEEYFVANVTECLKRCLSRDKCFSFNYEYFGAVWKKCELNNSTRAWTRDKYLWRHGFICYD